MEFQNLLILLVCVYVRLKIHLSENLRFLREAVLL